MSRPATVCACDIFGATRTAHYKLDNLIALVDVNQVQADGRVPEVMTVEPIADKWRAFGRHTQAVDGDSIPELLAALGAASNLAGKPKVIICYALMGKGVPFSPAAWSGSPLNVGYSSTTTWSRLAPSSPCLGR